MDGQFRYEELFSRNSPIINTEIQDKIRKLRVGVAGCGSTGGAFIDGCLRLGICGFNLADNGNYELSNLNRQMVDRSAINKNKAAHQSTRITAVNAEARCNVWPQGIGPFNLPFFLSGIDLVFDAVDVTTSQGIEMKVELHRFCSERGLPVVAALDLGYTQWIRGYNYHREDKFSASPASAGAHPLKTLFSTFCPIDALPEEAAEEVLRLCESANASACQLGSACFLLAALTGPLVLEFLESNALPRQISVDLLKFFSSEDDVKVRRNRALELHKIIRNHFGEAV